MCSSDLSAYTGVTSGVPDPYPGIDSDPNVLVTDSGEYIVLDSYFDYSPSQNLTISAVAA